jgi:hypothetical protein
LDSDALACPRGVAELIFVEVHRPFETLEFRAPYRIRGVQSFGDKWAFRRITSAPCREGVRSSNEKSVPLLGLIALQTRPENMRLRPRWRSKRDSNCRYDLSLPAGQRREVSSARPLSKGAVDGGARSGPMITIESFLRARPHRFYAATFLLPLPRTKVRVKIRTAKSPQKRFVSKGLWSGCGDTQHPILAIG